MAKLLGTLVSVEISSPDVEGSVQFYERKFGMRVVERADQKVYLRCWGDYFRYSVVIAPGASPALVNMTWRTEGEAALGELAERVEASGVVGEWLDGVPGQGRTYSFVGPYGHPMSLVWEVARYEAEAGFESTYPDRPERRSSHAAAPRFLDHVTVAASDVRGFAGWCSEVLGFRVMGYTDLDMAPVTIFAALTTNEKSHDLGIVIDTSQVPGRLHHVAFWADHPEDLVRTADVLIENGTPIEWGPAVHGIGEQSYLYFREPSTLRLELNSGGYRNYLLDWEPYTWLPSQGSTNFYRNWNTPDSMGEAFPAAEGMTATEDGASPELAKALSNPWATSASTTSGS